MATEVVVTTGSALDGDDLSGKCEIVGCKVDGSLISLIPEQEEEMVVVAFTILVLPSECNIVENTSVAEVISLTSDFEEITVGEVIHSFVSDDDDIASFDFSEAVEFSSV